MKDFTDLQNELNRLDDIVNRIEIKIHNLAGLLGLVSIGIDSINRSDETYESASISVVQEYLEAVEKEDIAKLYDKISELQKKV